MIISRRKYFYLFLSLFFCFSAFDFSLKANSSEFDTVVILNTTDIHSSLDDTPDESGRRANLLRLWTYLDQEKSKLAQTGKKPILIDCGDILQGSYAAMYSNGELGAHFLRANKYDIFVPGNHDFDFGFERFCQLAEKLPETAILAANIRDNSSQKWKILEREGYKIAIVGATVPYLDSFNILFPLQKLSKIDDELEEIIPVIMRQRPDAIIFAIHQGIFSPSEWGGINLAKIANRYPQINLFLGGHSHEENPGEKIGQSSWFVQAGSHGRTVARIEMIFSKNTKRIIDIKSQLTDINEQYQINKSDDKIQEIISSASNDEKIIIGETKSLIRGTTESDLNSEIRELISRSLSAVSGADIVLSSAAPQPFEISGKITRSQIFRILPYQDYVCTLELSEEEIRQIIDEQIKNLKTRHFYLPWGMKCIIGKNEVKSVEFPATELSGQKWKIAFSSFALSGAGGRFPLLAELARKDDCEFRNTGILVRDAVIKYISQNSPLEIKKTEWIITGN